MKIRSRWTFTGALLVIVLAGCGGEARDSPQAIGAEAEQSALAADDLKTVELRVPSMSCPLCSRSIEGRLKEAGLRDIVIDLETKTVTSRFDPDALDVDQIVALVEGQGFAVERAEVVDQSNGGGTR